MLDCISVVLRTTVYACIVLGWPCFSLALLARKSGSLFDCISVLLCTAYACTTLGGISVLRHMLPARIARSWPCFSLTLLARSRACPPRCCLPSRPTRDRLSSGTLACANCDCFYLLRMVILLPRRTYLAPEYVTTRTTTCALLVHLSLARPSAEKVQLTVRSQTGWDRLSWAGL